MTHTLDKDVCLAHHFLFRISFNVSDASTAPSTNDHLALLAQRISRVALRRLHVMLVAYNSLGISFFSLKTAIVKKSSLCLIRYLAFVL